MGKPVVIKSYIADGKDMEYPAIRKLVPQYVSDDTLKQRLARGVNTIAKLCVHPKDAQQSNGKRIGKHFNQTWKAQKQASIERHARKVKEKGEHGW